MGLYEEYKKNHADDVLISEISESMYPAIFAWLNQSMLYVDNPYEQAVHIKNKFRIKLDIPRTPPNNYLELSDLNKLIYFLMRIARSDSRLFFIIIDYMFAKYSALARVAGKKFDSLLRDAGHKYTVRKTDDIAQIVERVPEEEIALMEPVMSGNKTYSSEFRDAFTELYGANPNPTKSAGESFQAVESALKKHLGDDKGSNLGAILNWLDTHRDGWKYNTPSDEQTDANEQFLSLLNFVNKSYRKTKHGQADVKLTVSKSHAEVILRATALIIHELETTIELV